jgi:hypothetical protein
MMETNETPLPENHRSRRQFLSAGLQVAASVPLLFDGPASAQNNREGPEPFFKTRGVVLTTPDLSTLDWPQRAAQARLTTIATHVTPSEVSRFIQSDKGREFLAQCRERGLEVEHELHAMSDLLPRDLFEKDPSMYRVNEQGQRSPDGNCCVHSSGALEVICENLVQYAGILKPTTGRYFYWIDDGRPMCRCSRCRVYSDSEQALILENEMLRALQKMDTRATLAHLAYARTTEAPAQVKPASGIFLEFAPIGRTWSEPISHRQAKEGQHGRYLDWLDANLEVFGRDNAQVLEYWLDVSLFSSWKRNAKKKLPWPRDVFLQDIATYAARGIRRVTSFAVYIDADYVKQYGEPPLDEYGEGLRSWSAAVRASTRRGQTWRGRESPAGASSARPT